MLDQEKQKIIDDLLKQRSGFITIRSKISSLIEPRVFNLQLENFSNTRNSIVIAGALATIGFLILQNIPEGTEQIYRPLLRTAIIGFLLTVLAYSLYLDRSLSRGISVYRQKMQENISIVDRGEKIINDCLDGKILKEVADRQLLEVYKEIEFTKIRTQSKTEETTKKFENFLAIIGNVLFLVSILILIFSLAWSLIRPT